MSPTLAVLIAHTNERERVELFLSQLSQWSNFEVEVFLLDNGCVPEERLEQFLHHFQDLSVLYEASEEELSFGAAYNTLWRRAAVARFSWIWIPDISAPVDGSVVRSIWKNICAHKALGLVMATGLWISAKGMAGVGGFHEPYFWGSYFIADMIESLKERGFTVKEEAVLRDRPLQSLQHYFAARNPFLFARRHPQARSAAAVRRLFGSIQSELACGWKVGGWRGMGMAAHGYIDGWRLLLSKERV